MDPTVTPERIEVVDGSELVITWEDGTTSQLAAAGLRASCPCAGCREDPGRAQTQLVLGGPVPVTITNARLVGGYALSFEFAPDGHGAGIYPYEALYELGRSGGSS
jgi:DUF971 family protein